MATRAPRKPRGPAGEQPAGPPAGGSAPRAGAELFKASLKAVTGHNPLFEALIGMDPAAHAAKTKELFRLPSFEDLFDERVARALQRLGAAPALEALRSQLAGIDERLARLEQLLGAAEPGLSKAPKVARKAPRQATAAAPGHAKAAKTAKATKAAARKSPAPRSARTRP